MRSLRKLLSTMLLCSLASGLAQAETNAERIAEHLQPILSCLSGRSEAFCVSIDLDVTVDGTSQRIDGRLVRFDAQSFDLDLIHPEYSVRIRRRPDSTAFALPHHQVVFVGSGDVDARDRLAPGGMVDRLIGSGSMLSTYAPMLETADAAAVGQLLTSLLSPEYDAQDRSWAFDNDVSLQFVDNGKRIELKVGDQHRLRLTVEDSLPKAEPANAWPEFKQVSIERRELERTLARGVRRGIEVATPSRLLTSPLQKQRKVQGGELRWVQGQRVVLLKGTPEQVGFAHGSLLKDESQRCLDSVLYAFGTVNTIRTGRWFRHELDSAYEKLAAHIPEDHQREMLAFAQAMDWEPRTAQVINVFPELFHCSGFALFGKATKDGKLYHGRVLDYMTTIGLQDSATTFIVAIDGKHAFANIGYAGFIGSVSGMNDQAISLGEMGGGGEGQWDGVPMATLMRRALEECATLG